MSAATGNSPVSENDLEKDVNYTIKRRGQFVASGSFTGRYAPGGLLGPSPIFKIGDNEIEYARGHYSYYKEVKGGRRRTLHRRSKKRRSGTRRH
jgi:hypothetical protein